MMFAVELNIPNALLRLCHMAEEGETATIFGKTQGANDVKIEIEKGFERVKIILQGHDETSIVQRSKNRWLLEVQSVDMATDERPRDGTDVSRDTSIAMSDQPASNNKQKALNRSRKTVDKRVKGTSEEDTHSARSLRPRKVRPRPQTARRGDGDEDQIPGPNATVAEAALDPDCMGDGVPERPLALSEGVDRDSPSPSDVSHVDEEEDVPERTKRGRKSVMEKLLTKLAVTKDGKVICDICGDAKKAYRILCRLKLHLVNVHDTPVHLYLNYIREMDLKERAICLERLRARSSEFALRMKHFFKDSNKRSFYLAIDSLLRVAPQRHNGQDDIRLDVDEEEESDDERQLFMSDSGLAAGADDANKRSADYIFFCLLCRCRFKEKQTLKQHVACFHGVTWLQYLKAAQETDERQQVALRSLKDMARQTRKLDIEATCELTGIQSYDPWPTEKVGVRIALLCPACSKEIFDRRNLVSHIYTHHGKRANLPELLLRADDVYHSRRTASGLENKRLVQGLTTCPLCGRQRQGSTIFFHLKTCHANAPGFATVYADTRATYLKTKQQEQRLQQRVARAHKATDPSKIFPCRFCQKEFDNPSHRSQHQSTRCKANPTRQVHRCRFCSYASGSEVRIEEHIKRRHDESNPYICDLCGRTLRTRTALFVHKVRAHATEETKSNDWKACPICDKKFPLAHKLKIHMKRHEDSRAFQCELCGKAFKTNKALTIHQARLHDNKYSFTCSQCGHGIERLGQLKTHQCGRVRRVQNQDVTSQPALVGGTPAANVAARSLASSSGGVNHGTMGPGLVGQVPVGQQTVVKEPMGQSILGQGHMGQMLMGQGPMGQEPVGLGSVEQSPMGQGLVGQQVVTHGPVAQGPTSQEAVHSAQSDVLVTVLRRSESVEQAHYPGCNSYPSVAISGAQLVADNEVRFPILASKVLQLETSFANYRPDAATVTTSPMVTVPLATYQLPPQTSTSGEQPHHQQQQHQQHSILSSAPIPISISVPNNSVSQPVTTGYYVFGVGEHTPNTTPFISQVPSEPQYAELHVVAPSTVGSHPTAPSTVGSHPAAPEYQYQDHSYQHLAQESGSVKLDPYGNQPTTTTYSARP